MKHLDRTDCLMADQMDVCECCGEVKPWTELKEVDIDRSPGSAIYCQECLMSLEA